VRLTLDHADSSQVGISAIIERQAGPKAADRGPDRPTGSFIERAHAQRSTITSGRERLHLRRVRLTAHLTSICQCGLHRRSQAPAPHCGISALPRPVGAPTGRAEDRSLVIRGDAEPLGTADQVPVEIGLDDGVVTYHTAGGFQVAAMSSTAFIAT